ncbi:hypothetical protein ElyMa_004470400 [Elysia marginata]|uniref:Uncharacterized protein n=1 Tax=Elysia marginata TaxID=1093978 RepID=A0AAV4HIC4_9GAST|nr:hypothetical protein ElyMa_004470400 [Elysia marginata]
MCGRLGRCVCSVSRRLYLAKVAKVRHLLRDREVRGSIPDPSQTKDFKMLSAADPPSVWHWGFSPKSGRPSVRIMWLGVVYASAPYITVWQHAFNCLKRGL